MSADRNEFLPIGSGNKSKNNSQQVTTCGYTATGEKRGKRTARALDFLIV